VSAPASGRSRRAATALPLALAGLVGAQARVARRRGYLPRDPGYRVDGIVAGSSRATARRPLRLAVVGDSTVAGVGSPTVDTALPVLIATRLADRLGRAVRVDGFGVAGAETLDVAITQLPAAARVRPDVLVAVCGANDVIHATAPWRLRRDVGELAARAWELVGCTPVLGGIPLFQGVAALPRPLREVVVAYARVQRDVQRRAARAAELPLVEIASEASPRFAGVPASMSADRFHPAPVGYGFWADAIAPVAAAMAPTDLIGQPQP